MRTRWRLWYLRGLATALLLQGVSGGAMKLLAGELNDLTHSWLHAGWGLVGLIMRLTPWAQADA